MKKSYLKQCKQWVKKVFPFSVKLYDKIAEWKYRMLFLFSFLMWRQPRVFQRIKQKVLVQGKKIRVGFFVMENEKWACQTLYDKLKEHPNFEPVILLSSLNLENHELLQEKFYKNLAFFKRVCGDVIEVYDPQRHLFHSLEPYNLDIVFYEQPWSIAKEQNPYAISKFALSCYIPYCFEEGYEMIKRNYWLFQVWLYRKYISHNIIKKHYQKQGYKRNNMYVVGYPKMEHYLIPVSNKKKYVIYAPHHSVDEGSVLHGTFSWNGFFLLKYAKQNPQFNWVFKPHPRCKISLLKAGLFKNRQELENYYKQWATIGQVCEEGNYMELFRETKCLITDCISFLVEFFPTQQPVIHLRRTDSWDTPLVAEQIIPTYYSVFDLSTLENTLHTVLEEGKDPMYQTRSAKLRELELALPSSDRIICDFEGSFLKEDK